MYVSKPDLKVTQHSISSITNHPFDFSSKVNRKRRKLQRSPVPYFITCVYLDVSQHQHQQQQKKKKTLLIFSIHSSLLLYQNKQMLFTSETYSNPSIFDNRIKLYRKKKGRFEIAQQMLQSVQANLDKTSSIFSPYYDIVLQHFIFGKHISWLLESRKPPPLQNLPQYMFSQPLYHR